MPGLAFGSTTYVQSINNQSSVTITGSTHNLGSDKFGVRVYDSNGVLKATDFFEYTINSSTYDVSITFDSSHTGEVKLTGNFASDTSNVWDWKVTKTTGSGVDKAFVCGSCTDSDFARRTVSSKAYVALGMYTYTHNSSTAEGTLRVYLLDNKLVFGLSGSSSQVDGSTSGAHAKVEYSVSSFPTGAVQLASVTYDAQNRLGTVTDLRPW